VPRMRLLLLILLQVLLCSACTRTPDPPPWKDIITKTGGGADAQPAPKTSNHLIVYLDTSASMVGYISPDRAGQTIFSRSLQELRNFISIVNPPIDVVVRRVDSTISPAYPDSYLSEASVNQSVFTGKETDLAGAISLFDKPLELKKENPQENKTGGKQNQQQEESEDEEEPLPPARFHLLVTDGVQSRTQKSADENCLAGSDQTCVRKRLLALLNKGWGGYVIGMRSEFKGKIFSEVTRGTVVTYESKKRDPESFRPFYIYLSRPIERNWIN
jgi:hypothetical protein